MIVKIELDKLGFLRTGTSNTAMIAKTTTQTRPSRTMARCEASGAMYLLYRSSVKIDEAAFSMAASELITAPNRAAITNPNRPTFWGSIASSWPSAVSYLYATRA